MEGLLLEYLPILIFLGLAVALAGVIVLASYIIAKQKPLMMHEANSMCGSTSLPFSLSYLI